MTTDNSSLVSRDFSQVSTFKSLGLIPTWVVGRRYYTPAPTLGALLACEREPDNPHDSDAIAVYAPHAGKIGHLPRYETAYLAPLIDRGAIRLTARLVGDDDPNNRAPLRLEVWADTNAASLAGPASNSAAAIWHTQLRLLWQNRAHYAHGALADFRSEIRDLAHSGRLWPETQLLYRLLKGTVTDGEIAEERAREIVAKLIAEVEAKHRAAEVVAIRAAIACEPCGSLLLFGHLAVLPLRALRPAPTTPLAEALRSGAAALTLKNTTNHAAAFDVLLADDTRVLAVCGERLDTTAGLFRVAKDTVIEPGKTPCTLRMVTNTDNVLSRHTPVFISGAAITEPPLPTLPPEATGFAIFRGNERLRVVLYPHHACAVAALEDLRRMVWHLRPSSPALSPAAAFVALTPLFIATPFTLGLPLVRFDMVPGIDGAARLLDSEALLYLQISINESAFSAHQLTDLSNVSSKVTV